MGVMNPADKLIPTHFPSQAAIAKRFGLSKAAIALWFKDGIPTLQALKVEQETGGGVSAMEILEFAERAKSQRQSSGAPA